MSHAIIGCVGVFLTGILAGEEFVVRFGVRGPLATLDDRAHIRFRQALILKLRVLVLAIYVPTAVLAVVVAVLDGTQPGSAFRWAGVLALLVWILLTLAGTVPINAAALDWKPDAPPKDWKTLVERWERLNTFRTWAAVIAFACLLTASSVGRVS